MGEVCEKTTGPGENHGTTAFPDPSAPPQSQHGLTTYIPALRHMGSFRIQPQSLLGKGMTVVTVVWMENRRVTGRTLGWRWETGCLPGSGTCPRVDHLTILSPEYLPII